MDRSVADVYANLFRELALRTLSPNDRSVRDAARGIAAAMFEHGEHYDFAWSDLDADEDMIALDLAAVVDLKPGADSLEPNVLYGLPGRRR